MATLAPAVRRTHALYAIDRYVRHHGSRGCVSAWEDCAACERLLTEARRLALDAEHAPEHAEPGR